MPPSRTTVALVLALALLLVGCGGSGSPSGGGGGGGGAGGGGGGGGGSMSTAELQIAMDVLAEMNAHRSMLGLAALVFYDLGADVAYQHCLAMEADGFFDHTNPTTMSTPGSRAADAGITHDPQGLLDPGSGDPFVGENLAYAFGAPFVTYSGADAVADWIASPGHHTQIDAPMPVQGAQTMPAWTHCGIGVRATTTEIWFTAMFFRDPMP